MAFFFWRMLKMRPWLTLTLRPFLPAMDRDFFLSDSRGVPVKELRKKRKKRFFYTSTVFGEDVPGLFGWSHAILFPGAEKRVHRSEAARADVLDGRSGLRVAAQLPSGASTPTAPCGCPPPRHPRRPAFGSTPRQTPFLSFTNIIHVLRRTTINTTS